MSSPLNKTLPMSPFSNPANIFRVVVLPQPLGPSKVRTSFFLILRDKLFKVIYFTFILIFDHNYNNIHYYSMYQCYHHN